jgi:hypothetical protein
MLRVYGDLENRTDVGCLPHAGHQRRHGWSLRQPPRHADSCGRSRARSGTATAAAAVLLQACGPELLQAGARTAQRIPQCRGQPVRRGVRRSLRPCLDAANRMAAGCPVSTVRADTAVTRPCSCSLLLKAVAEQVLAGGAATNARNAGLSARLSQSCSRK